MFFFSGAKQISIEQRFRNHILSICKSCKSEETEVISYTEISAQLSEVMTVSTLKSFFYCLSCFRLGAKYILKDYFLRAFFCFKKYVNKNKKKRKACF